MRISSKQIILRASEDRTLIVSENEVAVIHTPLAGQILDSVQSGLSDGKTLFSEFLEKASIKEVLSTLFQLREQGYVTDQQETFPIEQMAYWEELGIDPLRLFQRLQSQPVSIKTLGSVDEESLRLVLEDSGCQFSDDPSIQIVITDDYLNPELERVNKESLATKMPWLLVKTNGTSPRIGPLFDPRRHGSACWKCLQQRLLLHDVGNRVYQALTQSDGLITRPVLSHPAVQQMTASVTVLEMITWLYYGENRRLVNQLIELNPMTGERMYHNVVKRPQCRACGSLKLSKEQPEPILLQYGKNTTSLQGGYRTVSPEMTFNRLKQHISPVTGVVPYVRKRKSIVGELLHNYVSGRNMALQSKSMFWMEMHARSANGGKGRTDAQAKTGALCESIERYCLMYPGEGYSIKSSYYDLPKAIHPNICMRFSDEQISNRELTNAKNPKFYALVPAKFDLDMELDWTPVYNLTQQEFNYLPSCFCYTQYPSHDEMNLYAYPDSNGCAAGNTREEAILQGFLEVVERDAAAIWWYNKVERPCVDLESSDNDYILEMANYYQGLNRSLHVLDITTDMGIPVFVAISHNRDSNKEDEILFAFGAHVDAGIALERAVVELNQLLPIVENENGKWLTKDPLFVEWLRKVRLSDHSYLNPKKGRIKRMSDYPSLCEPNLYDSIQLCIGKARENGMDTLVLDLTQPDIELPVVRVFVPGMRHMWRRTGPGRLYEIPVKMGWLEKPYKEEELNPYSIFI